MLREDVDKFLVRILHKNGPSISCIFCQVIATIGIPLTFHQADWPAPKAFRVGGREVRAKCTRGARAD